MKKIIAILMTILLMLAFAGCGDTTEMPDSAIYTKAGAIEILDVKVDETLGSDAVKYIKITVNFINTSNNKLFVSIDNILGYYDGTLIQPYTFADDDEHISISAATLDPGVTHKGYIWFKIPIDVEVFTIECTTEAGMAMFIYNV
jgi:hypothetical protein